MDENLYIRKQQERPPQVDPSPPNFSLSTPAGVDAAAAHKARPDKRERARTERALEQEAQEYYDEVEKRCLEKKKRRRSNSRLRRKKLEDLKFQEFISLKRVRFGTNTYWPPNAGPEPPSSISGGGGRGKREAESKSEQSAPCSRRRSHTAIFPLSPMRMQELVSGVAFSAVKVSDQDSYRVVDHPVLAAARDGTSRKVLSQRPMPESSSSEPAPYIAPGSVKLVFGNKSKPTKGMLPAPVKTAAPRKRGAAAPAVMLAASMPTKPVSLVRVGVFC